MSQCDVSTFCDKIKSSLDAAECLAFSGRIESLIALFDVIQLEAHDCVYVSAFAPRELIKMIIMCGAVPILCDVTPDSLTIDPKALENTVRHTISEGSLYPRAVIADNFCGMPFASRAVKSVCNRMGLLLIEDCGKDFGGVSDGMPCGSVGDYALVSLGSSSLFGTGGSSSLLIANKPNSAEEYLLKPSCGSLYQSVDEMYGDALRNSLGKASDTLAESGKIAAVLDDMLAEYDCWIQRGSGRQKSSCGSVAVVSRDDVHCKKIVEALSGTEFAVYAKPVHTHTRGCFDNACKGFKDTLNASAIAPRAFVLDIFGAVHSGNADALSNKLKEILQLICKS